MYQRQRKFPCLRSQRRGVLYANTHVCASEIGRFSFIAKRNLQCRNLTLYFVFVHSLKCPLESVARKLPQIPLVCVCVHLHNLTPRLWFHVKWI